MVIKWKLQLMKLQLMASWDCGLRMQHWHSGTAMAGEWLLDVISSIRLSYR